MNDVRKLSKYLDICFNGNDNHKIVIHCSCRYIMVVNLHFSLTCNWSLITQLVFTAVHLTRYIYINGLIKELRQQQCGVQFGSETFPGLLFADDTALVAPNTDGLTKSLNILVKWCEQWGVLINVEKSGIMHVRRRVVERCKFEFLIEGQRVPMVSSYKYLGCIIDEHIYGVEEYGGI